MAVGDIYGFDTSNVIGKKHAYKHHLCVCDRTHQYLLVCKRQFPDDFPLTNVECPGLEREESYVSLSRVLFVPRIPRNADLTCTVSTAYLVALRDHVASSVVMIPVDQMKVLTGLSAHLMF